MEGEQTKTGNSIKIVEPPITVPNPRNIQSASSPASTPTAAVSAQVVVTSAPAQSKYVQLLNVIEELGRDIRPTYAGSRSSAERIKRGIVHARILVRECLIMFTTLETFDTKFSADSVEWCPIDGFNDLFVCGTYELTKEKEELLQQQKRLGKIFLFRIISPGKLQLLQEINVPAVLDMKWAHVKCQKMIFLGVVNSIGYLQIYQLLTNENENKIELIMEKKLRKAEEEILALSLDWSTGKFPNCDKDGDVEEAKIIVSDSKGWITLFNLKSTDLNIVESKRVHDFEAWIAAFNYWDPNTIYSGGDDCKFKIFDARMGLQSAGCCKHHGAGVTSLHSNAFEEFSLASGSYDEILRLWDTRNFRCPISETNLGGGIWRLKWDPFYGKYLFAACMYGGFRLVDCKKKECPEVIGEYNEHESIAYGCDWSFLSSEKVSNDKLSPATCQKIHLSATCSFYDHTLKLSSINFKD
ncbi:hypothetical protein PV325_001246 [Microctonus aethiopoides]|nr:hypothetical protein PV325_001246 [Microctonus aethiopoides]